MSNSDGSALEQLKARFRRISGLNHAMTFLGWDQMVMMPDQGMAQRSESMAELAALRHELLADEAIGELLQGCENLAPTTEQQAMLREMRLSRDREVCLPASLVKAKILAGSKCEHQWRTQREDNDWPGFLENFRAVVDLAREEASIRYEQGDYRNPYEALLDLYCTGDSANRVESVFETLRESVPELVVAVTDRQKKSSTSSYQGDFHIADQKALNEVLMGKLGFDFSAGRLDVSVHPFSTGDRGDQRITTRFTENEFAEALLGTAHETGHASYEGNLPEAWAGLPLGESRNMCIHESQSLLFEKQIFLSRSFFSHFYKDIKQAFPKNIGDSPDQLWAELLSVEPGYIRVEADEVTYPLHVMLRYEIERDLMNGEMEAEQVPDAWEEKMQDYLGLSVDYNHKIGCMQDIHWTDGSFGYFPSYTMGAVNGAQLFKTIRAEFPDWQSRFSSGDIGFVREWLNEKIWSQGCFQTSQQLIKGATGESTNAAYLLEHLHARYMDALY
ncbi:MAG: carboxypeptidase M32 [Granulosicoccus sp.]|nr:carboxypeptidase M32 [Granulosicoccus sp.]